MCFFDIKNLGQVVKNVCFSLFVKQLSRNEDSSATNFKNWDYEFLLTYL